MNTPIRVLLVDDEELVRFGLRTVLEAAGDLEVVGEASDGNGALDLAGNVWEWVTGRYDDEPDRRVVRGGSCCSYFVEPRAANRNAWAPDHRDGDLGFRCVGR